MVDNDAPNIATFLDPNRSINIALGRKNIVLKLNAVEPIQPFDAQKYYKYKEIIFIIKKSIQYGIYLNKLHYNLCHCIHQ